MREETSKELKVGGWILEKTGDALLFSGGVGIALVVILYMSSLLNIGIFGLSCLFLGIGALIAVNGYIIRTCKEEEDETTKTSELLPGIEQQETLCQ